MLTYPEGMLVISSQHRKEMIDEAQRWRLVRRARRTRRDRHTTADGTTNRTNRSAGADAPAGSNLSPWADRRLGRRRRPGTGGNPAEPVDEERSWSTPLRSAR